MAETIIKVENISKSYVLKHQNAERYTALRDVIARKTKELINPGTKKAFKSTEEFWALNDVSFEVKQGERIGIIGRNGAGKSTLLKVLSRIITPTKGRITIDGRIASLLEVGTGFHPELSGRENIFLNGSILGMSKNEIQRKFDEIVAFSEVERFLDTPVKRYSSGMYVRLAFAVAAHLEPEILIVDEVLAVGDAEFQKKCIGKMKDVSGEGRTVLFVSHNMAAIQSLCDKAIVMKKGMVEVPSGDVTNAVRHYMKSTQENSKIDLRERKDRQGEGNIRFVNFEFVNEEGQSQVDLITGQYVKIKLDYESQTGANLSNITVGVAIYGDDGFLYTLVANEFSSGPFSSISAKGSFVCELKKLPIVAGKYMINIIVNQNGIMEDWVQEAVTFDVEDGDFYGTGKIVPGTHRSVLIENTWNLY
ncbi:MAG TPA: ABC transporter ATP-binding protein [Bacteroidia bacterium]|jgi:lipopolysaccharide transport system ATP-binding protein